MPAKITTIGRVTTANFPDSGIINIPVKIDTGAYRSSIWATKIHEENGVLHFRLLGPSSEYYTGKDLETTEYKIVEVENSFAHKQDRYSVFLKIEIGGKISRSNFTLANRSTKTYSVLIGRKLLKNRFVVDVSKGDPLQDEEINGDDSLE